MAVSIADLIAKKEKITAAKKALYDIPTSAGILTVKKPTAAFMAEVWELDDSQDEYLILNMTVDPDLQDSQLQKAYGCAEPLDIVRKLFDGGEIAAISKAIMKTAGYRRNDIQFTLHEAAKN